MIFQEESVISPSGKSRMGVSLKFWVLTNPDLRLPREKFDDNNALWITHTHTFFVFSEFFGLQIDGFTAKPTKT